MSAQPGAPIIIKRKKVIAGGHHGGAWKVAYADFVTAMMAFFLLMWLLGATNEKQRKGIADYFNPTIPVNKVSGGGSGAFGGDSIFSQNTLANNGQGTGTAVVADNADRESNESEFSADRAAEEEAFKELEEKLSGRSGESMVSDLLMRHIVTRLTDEGLIVEIFDLPDQPLFDDDNQATDALLDVLAPISEVFRLAANQIAIQGHVASVPVVSRKNLVWENSTARAEAVRKLLLRFNLDEDRAQRVAGFADGKPVARNRLASRNNRIELILLRSRL